MLTIIAAITAGKRAIGRHGDLVYHVSDDLRHFKALTTGHTIIMGRRTFDSLPKGALPNRRNIVVTRNAAFCAPGTEIAPSLDAALTMAAADGEVFIIGGGQIYAEAMPRANKLCLTVVEASDPDDADTFFPEINPEEWEMESTTELLTDSRSALPFRFVDYIRK